ncbi:MAG: cutinase family protein [Streptococcaceae bacterium]|jgi:hypothetical protein|nr:cutinase family protein [Streptococcaceae bacterium]
MQNPETGFNAYFVTDQEKLEDTNQAYFVIHGSDAKKLTTTNDWIDNNAYFTMTYKEIPQIADAKVALHQKIQELTTKSPNAKVDITGHSLGTMVSIQTLMALSPEDIDHIGHVVLFDGPDARASIQHMGPNAAANIEKLEAAGKIDYYINPFDLVSNLNRASSRGKQIGNVHLLVPTVGTQTYDGNSAHDFVVMQTYGEGKHVGEMVVAELSTHPGFSRCTEVNLQVKLLRKPLKVTLR